MDRHIIEAVAFLKFNESGGEREDSGVDLKLSLQLGQIPERSSIRCFFFFLADCL